MKTWSSQCLKSVLLVCSMVLLSGCAGSGSGVNTSYSVYGGYNYPSYGYDYGHYGSRSYDDRNRLTSEQRNQVRSNLDQTHDQRTQRRSQVQQSRSSMSGANRQAARNMGRPRGGGRRR